MTDTIPAIPAPLPAMLADPGVHDCNREHMTIVIEALESGKYPQGRDWLRIVDWDWLRIVDWDDVSGREPPPVTGWCCAGVAADKARADGVGNWGTDGDDMTFYDTGALGLPLGGDGDFDGGGPSPFSDQVLTAGGVAWLGITGPDAQNLPCGTWADSAAAYALEINRDDIVYGTFLNDHGVPFDEIAGHLRVYYGIPRT
jgi:hypothetical protein